MRVVINDAHRISRETTMCLHRLSRLTAAATIMLPLAQQVAAETLSLTPVKDVTLFEDSIDAASGASSFIFAGPIASGSPRRALLQFDLSALPPTAVVNAVRLRVVVNRQAIGSENDEFSLHRVTASWGEGTSDGGTGAGGALASAGDATWRSRVHGAPPAIPQITWQTPGGDFSAAASVSVVVSGTGLVEFTSSPGLLADVAAWRALPASNHGWLLRGPEGEAYSQRARRIVSRESPSVNERPTLVVDYMVPTAGAVHRVPAMPWSAVSVLALSLGLAGASRMASRRKGPGAGG